MVGSRLLFSGEESTTTPGSCPLQRPNDEAIDAPCRTAAREPALANPKAAVPRTLPLGPHQRAEIRSSKRLPSTGPFRPVPAGAENETWGPPLIPRLGRHGPASDAPSPALECRLGPRATGYSPVLARATRRPSISTIVWTSEHDLRCPDSAALARGRNRSHNRRRRPEG